MSKKFKIGIDYGGTKIEGILLDQDGKQIERKRYLHNKNYISGIEIVKKLVNELDDISGQTCSVGIGIPGFSSKDTGLITNSNALWLNDKPFGKDLEIILNREVRLMNDANCLTLSEAIDGAGKNYDSVFGIIIGSGFGGGLSYKKEIIEGSNQIAGDWGHQPLPYPTDEEYKVNVEFCELGARARGAVHGRRRRDGHDDRQGQLYGHHAVHAPHRPCSCCDHRAPDHPRRHP